jgi:tetratricopeptide (TPR) repeat protein
VDDEQVMMCTELKGESSWFLPFNKGVDGSAGNPVNQNGLKTAYLWEEILTKHSLSDIIENYAQVIKIHDEKTRKVKSEKCIWPRYHQLDAPTGRLDERKKMQLGGVLLNIRNCLIMKKYADALEYLDRIEETMPSMRLRPDAVLLRAQALRHSGKPVRAEVNARKVLLLEPGPDLAAAATLELAELCRRNNRRLQAANWLKQTIKEAPQSRQAAAALRMLDELKEEKLK